MKSIIKKIAIWFFSVIICGIFVGIAGNKIYYEYFERSNLAYTKSTFRLASKDNNLKNKLKITINDKNVSELYITTISIVNNGNSIVSRGDTREESDPIRIEGRNIESIFVDKINTTANSKVKLKRRKRWTRIDFKWMNPGDVIVLKVVHHRPGDNIRVRGSVRGVSRIENINTDYDKFVCSRGFIFAMLAMVAFAPVILLLIMVGIYAIWHRYKYGIWRMTTGQKITLYMIMHLKKLSRAQMVAVRRQVCRRFDDASLYELFCRYRDRWCG